MRRPNLFGLVHMRSNEDSYSSDHQDDSLDNPNNRKKNEYEIDVRTYSNDDNMGNSSDNNNNLNGSKSFNERGSAETMDLEKSDIEPTEQVLQQGLSSRAVQFIALGGAIGTGLFVGTSSGLTQCGPAGLLTSYIIMASVLYPIMNAFGEMVCYLPGGRGRSSQGSAAYLVSKYVDRSLGFATSWNYYYCYAILGATECTAAAAVVEYWTIKIPKAALISIYIFVIVLLNFGPVKIYGETEFWFAITKILCILGLIILCFILFWGGGPKHDRLGFRFWKGDLAFANHSAPGNTGRFLDVYTGIIKAGFAYILGPELVSLTSSECEDQRRNIAKASRRFVYRLIIFYCCSVLGISVIVSRKDPTLLTALSANKAGAASSPFVIGIINAGIPVLPHIINACIMLSAWSAGNAYMFAASRSLLTMANEEGAPKIFGRINRMGTPYVAVAFTTLWFCLAYLNVSSSSADVFNWLSNISTISGFIGWGPSCIAYLRFRKAIFYNGLYDRLPFKGPWMPYTIYYAFAWVVILSLTNGYQTFMHSYWNVSDFIAAYITLPVFFALLIGHKLYTRTFFTWKWYKPVEQIDVITGLEEIEEITKEIDENRKPPSSIWQRFIDWLI
ncbi:Proline-specific permease [Maudiozyma exigua]|uniref:Proline-specific permease n=1 Tax=Maudiozyma exigua TaxID=34358 RepID=A0A9P7BCC6_MAUEX|nr:Proline-specific permease [Kazachstania exigua]